MDKLESIMLADGGFNDKTIMKLLASLLNDLKIPVTSLESDHVRFRPIGASTYGGYIYKSGVIVIFNEHYAPMSSKTSSLRDALKELCRKSKFAYLPIYNAVCRYRTLYLLSCGKDYEEVYGYDSTDDPNIGSSVEITKVRSEMIPEEELTSYVDSRIPYKESVYAKNIIGETTIWDLAKLIRGDGVNGKSLTEKTRYARRVSGKLGMPVVMPNFHLAEVNGKYIKIPNNTVMLDFDLMKLNTHPVHRAKIRAIVANMNETILVSDSFTKGNFWAIVAASHPMYSYEKLAISVMSEIEIRLRSTDVGLDRTSARMNQMRFIVHDKNLLIKHPTMKFVEKS